MAIHSTAAYDRYNALFLCTGNSARSVLAEAYLNFAAPKRFQAFSAGSHPKGEVHPLTLETLKLARVPAGHPRSKSWDEFASAGAPPLHFVITVCDNAAGEVCPIWPGQPMSAHWGFPDPAAATGSEAERRAVFADVFRQIRRRLDIFLSLPISSLDRLSLQKKLDDIGRSKD